MRNVLLAMLLLLTSHVYAIQPEPGLWWNAAQSGRGFAIEVQNGTLFFAGYLYNANGTATWYAAQGPYSNAASSFTGPLLAFSGGQCVTCTYVAPTLGTSPGNLTLSFTSLYSGTLTWPGGVVPITRTVYGTSLDIRRVLGGWAYSAVIANTLDAGDWLTFTSLQTTTTATGAVGTNLGGRLVVALLDSFGNLGALVDTSTSYYTMFLFPSGPAGIANQGEGRYWLYLKTGSPTGAGSPARALKFGPGPQLEANPMQEKASEKAAEMYTALQSAMAAASVEPTK